MYTKNFLPDDLGLFMPACKICDLHSKSFENIEISKHWIVREAESEKYCQGYLYVESKQHIEKFTDFSIEVWHDLSEVLNHAYQWIYANYSPLKVYQVTISELVPHIHYHLVPRYQEDIKGFDYLSAVVQGKWKQ
jgi:diadenosine tetraphosphate (Ap4A) HIT family hydrolase